MDSLWKELIDYARWSPSPHNIQAWKVKILSSSEAELFYDPKRLLPNTDPTGRFTMAGFGIFVENLSIAAHHFGQKVQARYYTDLLDSKRSSPTPLARLVSLPAADQEVFDRELIKKRRTSRLQYDNTAVNQTVLEELQRIAKTFGHTLTISEDPELIAWVLRLNTDTLFYDMSDKKARKEVGSWIRYSSREAHRKQDGLWAYCLGFPGLLLYLFIHGRLLFELPIIRSMTRSRYFNTTTGTKTIAWLAGPFEQATDWVNAGHMLARLWLCMTSYNVYLHPFGSIITNEKSHKRLRGKIRVNEGDANMLWLIMRLGYSTEPPRSLRLSLDEILIV